MKKGFQKAAAFLTAVLMLTTVSLPVGAVSEVAQTELQLSFKELSSRVSSVDGYIAEVTEAEESQIDAELEQAWEKYYSSGAVCIEYQNSSYNFSSDYLYSQLNSSQKALYQQMADECLKAAENPVNYTTTISVNNNATGEKKSLYILGKFNYSELSLTEHEALTAATAFFYSNPQYFFVGQIAWNTSSIYLTTYDGYEKGTARTAAAQQIDAITETWLAEFSKGADDLQKEALIYRKICDEVTYHKDESGNAVSSGSNQTIAGALLNKTCVCNGYAMTVTYFCHLLGIDCIGIVGNNHAWNAVKLNGNWYDLDVTWMDGYEITGVYNYNYCNRGNGVFMALDSSGYHNPQERRYDNVDLPDSRSDNPLYIPLTVSNVTDSSADLNWEIIYASQGYGVYRYQSGAYYLMQDISEYYTNSCTATNLDFSSPCGFFIRAKIKDPVLNTTTWTAYTSSCIAYPEKEPVEVQKPVITKAIAGDGQVGLNWTASEGAEKYAVYSYLNGKWTLQGYRNETGMYVKNLVNGTKYGFAVKAYVNGEWTDITSSDIVYATPSAPVTKPAITKTIIGDGQIGLNWTAVDGAENYAVYSYINGKWTLQGYRTATGMYVKNLVNGTKYGFAVKAYVNGAWTSVTSSDIVYATPSAPVTKPVITKTIIGDVQIGLNWTAVDGAENYAVYSYINGKWTLQGYRTATGMYVKNLVNGIKYGFAVKAYVNGEWTSVTSSDIVYATPNA